MGPSLNNEMQKYNDGELDEPHALEKLAAQYGYTGEVSRLAKAEYDNLDRAGRRRVIKKFKKKQRR